MDTNRQVDRHAERLTQKSAIGDYLKYLAGVHDCLGGVELRRILLLLKHHHELKNVYWAVFCSFSCSLSGSCSCSCAELLGATNGNQGYLHYEWGHQEGMYCFCFLPLFLVFFLFVFLFLSRVVGLKIYQHHECQSRIFTLRINTRVSVVLFPTLVLFLVLVFVCVRWVERLLTPRTPTGHVILCSLP